jgi:hypothetical protein
MNECIKSRPAVLYECEAWCLTLGEEYKLRLFENWVLRRTFELKGGGWEEAG